MPPRQGLQDTQAGLDIVTSGFGLVDSLFGSGPTSGSGTTKGIATKKGTTKVTERLDISDVGIQSFINDILSGNQGLKDIFSEEQAAGIFNSSVSAQASGNLLAQVAGQLAQLTGRKVREEEIDVTDTQDSTTTSEQSGTEGILGGVFGEAKGVVGKSTGGIGRAISGGGTGIGKDALTELINELTKVDEVVDDEIDDEVA